MKRILFKLLPWMGWLLIFLLAVLLAVAPPSARKSFFWALEKSLHPTTPEPWIEPDAFTPPARYFPDGALDSSDAASDKMRQSWLVSQLSALQEPSLLDEEGECYRFLYLRSFHTPVSVRIFHSEAGKWRVVSKRSSGGGGYSPGNLELEIRNDLSEAQAGQLQKLLAAAAIWPARPPEKSSSGFDGSQWILEAKKGADYTLFDRWCGGEDPGFRALCLWLLRIGHVDQGPIY